MSPLCTRRGTSTTLKYTHFGAESGRLESGLRFKDGRLDCCGQNRVNTPPTMHVYKTNVLCLGRGGSYASSGSL